MIPSIHAFNLELDMFDHCVLVTHIDFAFSSFVLLEMPSIYCDMESSFPAINPQSGWPTKADGPLRRTHEENGILH